MSSWQAQRASLASSAHARHHAAMEANEVLRLSRNLIRKGRIVAVNPAAPACRVATVTDGQGLTTDWIPWIAAAAGATREWLPPTEGEQVILLCPMGDPAQGVALCGLYSDASPAPDDSAAIHSRVYPDGAVFRYDHAAHTLKVELPAGANITVIAPGAVTVHTGRAAIEADTVTLEARQTTCTGALLVKGMLAFEGGMSGKGGDGKAIKIEGGAEFSDDVIAAGVSVATHLHVGRGKDVPTSPPVGGAA
jgi:phage baseplate assembly protein V